MKQLTLIIFFLAYQLSVFGSEIIPPGLLVEILNKWAIEKPSKIEHWAIELDQILKYSPIKNNGELLSILSKVKSLSKSQSELENKIQICESKKNIYILIFEEVPIPRSETEKSFPDLFYRLIYISPKSGLTKA